MVAKVQVVFDCADPARVAGFWEQALHYVSPGPPPPHATWEHWAKAEGIPEEHWNDASAVEDPDGEGPRLFFQKVPEGKVAKNRMHLDLNVGGGSSVPIEERRERVNAEVPPKQLGAPDERGATRRGRVRGEDERSRGNEFCVQYPRTVAAPLALGLRSPLGTNIGLGAHRVPDLRAGKEPRTKSAAGAT